MKRRSFLKTGAAITAAPIAVRAAAPSRPNFVFFLADDLGWTDLGCYGSTFYESPNLDRLCRESLKFTNAYAAGTVCSPTRASIITGRFPVRTGCTQFGWNIRGTEYCFAQELTKAGYATFFTGKWHVGGKSPAEAGFTDNRELSTKNPTDDPKGTRNITENTVDFLKGVKGKPFFAYVNYHAVHIPLNERQDVVDKYVQKLETNPPKPGKPAGLEKERDRDNKQIQDDPNYAAVLKVMDDSVGRILETVHAIGADTNTIIVFTSDNGGLSTKPSTSNLPLRAGKGWIYEGGIRVPAIIKWPGVTKAETVSDVPVVSTDYYPTILEMAGLPLRPQDHVDGVSLAELLQTGTAPKRKEIYWHYPHNHGAGCSPCGAVRIGDYKLIQFFEENKIELYNLKDDLSEMNDLAAKMPEKRAELFAKLKAWQQTFPDIKYKATKTVEQYNSAEKKERKTIKNRKR